MTHFLEKEAWEMSIFVAPFFKGERIYPLRRKKTSLTSLISP
jgi:hypothetical protein